ncbi:hypothetical protein [Sphingobium sp. YC-XJ3]|uniref:hypothetical protein n=1 Tax=Sphingobium sp. YC-XJ3 TaxID=3024245 RepID=UPI00235E7821|nr:hypothetical protein [Sphingobium sp. YC-XJ3]WDA37869.1 hypothetical protein PO876_06720 [Sphingobium sp. YC-XJ3]
MTNYSIQNQLPVFLSATGAALNAGKAYIGLPNQDPQTFPKAVYWDQARTDPVDQASGIDIIGGYITRAGSPATIYISGSYSVRVRDRFGAQVYYIPEVNDDIVDLTAQLLTTAGAGMIGYSLAATYPAGTVGKKLQQTINPLDAPYSATGDGVADDRTALAAADAAAYAAGRPLYITGNHRISSDMTIQSDLFFIGGKLTVDSGKTVTCRGEVSAPTQQVFAGAGTVVGIRRVRPEWFGAARDGSSDDAVAINAANACVMQSATSRGAGRPTIALSQGTYAVASKVSFTPTSTINLRVRGAGSGVDGGTCIQALSSYTGTIIVHIDGQSNALADRIADYDIGGFRVKRDGTVAQAGVFVGGNATDINLVAKKKALIEDIHVEEMPICWQFNQCRLIDIRRCSGWSETVSGGVGIKFSCTDPLLFTGDMDFYSCDFVSAVAVNGANILVDMAAGGQCKGIRWHGSTFYKANLMVSINLDNGADVGDWWFNPGCQFDGFSNNFFSITLNDASDIFNNFHVEGCYFRGGNTDGRLFITDIVAGDFSSIFFQNNWVADMSPGANPVMQMKGAMAGINISGNTFEEIVGTSHIAIFYDSASGISFDGNTFRKRSAASMAGWVVFGASTNEIGVYGNKSTGSPFTGTVVSVLGAPSKIWNPAGSNF